MNRNGIRDYVETVTETWQRLGLLKPKETFNRDQYVRCVSRTADSLMAARFLSPKVAELYKQEARTRPLPAR